MRDAHRMKEKFDVSLDNRQIVSLLIAGIVVLGAVFVLGVVVGKKLAGDAQTANSPDLLSALDANAQALQEVQTTFQDELTRKAAAEPSAAAAPKPVAARPPAPAAAPAAKPAEPTPAPKATALAPTPDPDTGELPPEEPEEEKEAVAAAEPPKAAPEPAPAPAAEKPAPAVAKVEPVSGKVEVAPVPTRTTDKAGGGLKEAIARTAQPPAQAVKDGAFTLQLSAFQSKAEADSFVARLRGKGYAPYIISAEVPGKGTWYRVRMGSFKNREAASKYLSDFKRETQLDAFVAGIN